MVLGLLLLGIRFETQRAQIIAKLAEWLLHEETGEMPGAVGNDLSPTKADEQGVVFVVEPLWISPPRGFTQCQPGLADLAGMVEFFRVFDMTQVVEQIGGWNVAQQRCQDGIRRRPRLIFRSDESGRLFTRYVVR